MKYFPQRPLKHPYYIVAPSYTRSSAGIRVLHLLCHCLRQIGYEAYMVSEKTNIYLDAPKINADVVTSHFQASITPIVIYPETVFGNPYCAPFVVRYLLNFPGLLGGPTHFDSSEYIISYAKGILSKQDENEKTLFFPVSDTSIFYPPPAGTKRSGTCYYAGKYKDVHRGKLLLITANSREITRDHPHSETQFEIAEIFRKSEIFYCYENSALTLEATLCGCPVVLLPNEHFTEMIASKEIGTDGIAWGESIEELDRARRTVHKAWGNYQRLLNQFWTDLQRFATETQAEAGKIRYQTPIGIFYPLPNTSLPKSRGARVRQFLFVMFSALYAPPNIRGLRNLYRDIKSHGYKGLLKRMRERETRLGKRYLG